MRASHDIAVTPEAQRNTRRRQTHQSALPFARFSLLIDLKRLPDERYGGGAATER